MSWNCRYCGKSYRWDTGLMRHMKAEHLEEMKAEAKRNRPIVSKSKKGP